MSSGSCTVTSSQSKFEVRFTGCANHTFQHSHLFAHLGSQIRQFLLNAGGASVLRNLCLSEEFAIKLQSIVHVMTARKICVISRAAEKRKKFRFLDKT